MGARLYLDDSYLRRFAAEVVDASDGACVLSATAFHPGGGGQPHDRGTLTVRGRAHPVLAVHEDAQGRIWHEVGVATVPGEPVEGELDWGYRHALMRHHALMHVVNTIALHALGGVITGAQLGPAQSRIDLRLTGFTRDGLAGFEAEVNAVLARALAIHAAEVDLAEYERRPELVRTLAVRPPVVDGRVRVVTIDGFDTQACGGTHVHSTAEIGVARIVRFDNKGKDNKRFYWTLAGA